MWPPLVYSLLLCCSVLLCCNIYYFLSLEFMPPSPPEHLEEARSIVKDGNVDVKIQWQPPLYTDGLLIHKYEVSDCPHTHTHARTPSLKCFIKLCTLPAPGGLSHQDLDCITCCWWTVALKGVTVHLALEAGCRQSSHCKGFQGKDNAQQDGLVMQIHVVVWRH